jgi:fatty-acyl-CoA synthase
VRSEDALLATARAHVAPYKLPRRFVFLERIVRAPSGKADYRWAREAALGAQAETRDGATLSPA